MVIDNLAIYIHLIYLRFQYGTCKRFDPTMCGWGVVGVNFTITLEQSVVKVWLTHVDVY